MEANEKKIQLVENSIAMHSENLHDINDHADQVESQLEYLENQSRRSNVRITGVIENKDSEKSWDDTEKVVKEIIKEKLNITEDIEIERCHRVNRRNNSYRKPNQVDQPRPIVAKFSKWKDKERVLRMARQLRPEGVRFLADLSRPGPRKEFLGPGSECCMGPLSNEFRKEGRMRTRAPEAHPPRGVRGHAPPGKFLKVRLLESLWSLFLLLDTIVKSYNKLVIMHKNHYIITINRQ